MIVDATNLILGRMATAIAKQALRGQQVDVVNCEKAVVTGNRKRTVQRDLHKRKMGQPTQGPFIQTTPRLYVRRTIKGMLPARNPRGKAVLEKVKCYAGIPEHLANEKMETVKDADVAKVPNTNYISIGQLCREMRERQ